jgi:integrase
MAPKSTKRRSPGEGSVWPYQTMGGERWAIGHPSFGTRRNAAGWGKTKRTAQQALRDMLTDASRGELVDPSKQPLGAYLEEWAAGLRLAPSTVASYRKNIRLHITPALGAVPLAALTTERVARFYRDLEKSGRKDHREGEGLSPRTVRYIHTILSAALKEAAETHRIVRNPAAGKSAKPPTAKQAKSPEMHPWTAGQLAAFLGWACDHADNFPLWHVLAFTGMRRGEALALRWRDVGLDEGTVRVRRSAGMIRNAGEGAGVVEGPTKTDKPRLVDLDGPTVAVLRARKRERGALALQLARDDALVFGDIQGDHRNPEHVSRQFARDIARARGEPGGQALPVIRLHDLRHTHATILLTAREPVHVVSARLGHASAVVTMTVYAHVLPGSQRDAADRFAALVGGAQA